MSGSARDWLWLIASAAVAALVAIVVWVVLPRGRVGEPVATREPKTFPAESILTVSLDRIKRYADRLQFDEGLGADSELVDFGRGQIGTGTPAKIEPEMDSYLLDRQDLASGRIIARIRTATDVPQLGFGNWYTWWWVDKRGPGETWRSIYIAETEKSPADRRPRPDSLEQDYHGGQEYHGGRRYRQALARWEVVSVKTPHGDPLQIASWGSCNPCCRQRLPVVPPP